LSELVNSAVKMTTTELLGLSGIEPKRVDMILAGAVLFEEIMLFLEVKKARTTEFSLRDGILEEELQLYASGAGGGSHLALHLPDIREKARQFGADAAHMDRVVRLADALFDALRPLHRLDPSWKTYLSAAVMLRDVGETVNLAGHEEHSCYIVRHSDFPGADLWENELIAELCLHHEGAKTPVVDSAVLKSKGRRDAFMKLLAILRIADALDSGPETHIRLQQTRILRGRVELRCGGRGLTGLESLQVEKKAPFFARIFKRDVVAFHKKSKS
jgi:exopolyphosphatase/guanosine-5'-triphosphate,3'-diphosphate pyrophosphatase